VEPEDKAILAKLDWRAGHFTLRVLRVVDRADIVHPSMATIIIVAALMLVVLATIRSVRRRRSYQHQVLTRLGALSTNWLQNHRTEER
jgi:hypothetical protein